MNKLTRKNGSAQNFITPTIINREDEYFMITKRELKNIEHFNTTMNVISEICTIVGSAGLGFILNLTPSLTKDYISVVVAVFILIFLAIYAKWGKDHTLSKVLKLYENQ